MATGKSIPANPQRGFTYLGLLMFVMISGIALASTGKVWHAEAQREKERELLFIGEQFRKAIGSYYENTTGVKQYPLTLQDLLEDKRLPQVRHHLRKIYRDPITGTTSWGLVREQGRITGVFSLSNFKPFKQDGFTREFVSFANAEQYTKWRFIHSLSAIELSSVPAGKLGTGAVGSVPPNVAQPAPGVISPPRVANKTEEPLRIMRKPARNRKYPVPRKLRRVDGANLPYLLYRGVRGLWGLFA